MRVRGRRMVTVGLVALLALGGAACSRSDRGGEEVAAVRPLDLMASVEGAGSARWAARIDSTFSAFDDGAGLQARVVGDIEGITDYEREISESLMSMRWEPVLPEGAVDEIGPVTTLHMEERRIGDDRWSREWVDGDEPGGWQQTSGAEFEDVGEAIEGSGQGEGQVDEWTEDEEWAEDDEWVEDEWVEDEWVNSDGDEEWEDEEWEDESAGLSFLLDPDRLDPVGVVELLREEVDLTEAGREERDGVATTRYRGTVEVAGSDEDLWPPGTEQGEVEVWVDDQGRLREVVAGGLEMRLWDFGVAVDVEPPTDLSDEGDWLSALDAAKVSGPWQAAATGTTGDLSWTVFAAPAREGDVEVTCRTLEVDGARAEWSDEEEEMALGLYDDEMLFPHHDGVVATCGSSAFGFGMGMGGPVSDPALQVLVAGGGWSMDDADLVAFVVSPRFRSAPLRVVADGEVVELPLDGSGLVVWDASTVPGVTAVELDSGAVRCPVVGDADVGLGGVTHPGDIASVLAYSLQPCVWT